MVYKTERYMRETFYCYQ